MKMAEKEVQDTACRGSGGVPQDWGIRGLIETISTVSYEFAIDFRSHPHK